MSKKSLFVLLFSIDIWASLTILQRQQRHLTAVAPPKSHGGDGPPGTLEQLPPVVQ